MGDKGTYLVVGNSGLGIQKLLNECEPRDACRWFTHCRM